MSTEQPLKESHRYIGKIVSILVRDRISSVRVFHNIFNAPLGFLPLKAGTEIILLKADSRIGLFGTRLSRFVAVRLNIKPVARS
jgi:hypothetical protein